MSKAKHHQKPTPSITPRDASRVQAAAARSSGGSIAKGSHVGRLQAAAVRNHGKPGSK